jgi:hypothetical protein
LYAWDEIRNQFFYMEVEMSTRTHTLIDGIRPFPFVGLLLVLGLVFGYALMTVPPAPASDLAVSDIHASTLSGREADSALERGRSADAARWQGRAIAYQMQQTGLSRAELADAARWDGMARISAARDAAALVRGRAADAARWQGAALAYAMQQTGLSRAELAEAVRWTSMAVRFDALDEHISPYILFLLGQ